MKIPLFIFLFFASLFLVSCSSAGVSKSLNSDGRDTSMLFSAEELKSDLNFLVKTSQDVHPCLYSAVDSSTFQSSVKKVNGLLNHPMTRLEFYRLAAPLLEPLKNGHTCLLLPAEEWQNFIDRGGRYFPYGISFDENSGIRVTSCRDSSNMLAPGTRILTINNLSADSLFNAFLSYRGGERDKWQNTVTSNWFRRYLWLNGISAPYEISYLASSSGKKIIFKSDGVSQTSSNSQISSSVEPPYAFEMLPGNIGYMNYKSMESDDVSNPFGEFLKRVFTELKEKSSRGLIVDLRHNGGGNAKYGYMLLSYITEKPFRMHAMKAWKSSAQYKEEMRKRIPWWVEWVSYRPVIWLAALFNENGKMFTASDGDIVELKTEEKAPASNPLLFHGKVCFLIGTDTFSSAMLLANAVSDYKLACLIGEETGGIPNEFGEVYYFKLPNTHLRVSMPSALFIRANGDRQNRRGVLPDIEVRQSPEDTNKKSDTVLEAAKKWIEQ